MEHSYIGADSGLLSFSEIGTRFKSIYPKPNFMSPKLLDYIDRGKYLVEISGGKGFDDKPIFGVTVISSDAKTKHSELNQMFYNYNEAIKYMEAL